MSLAQKVHMIHGVAVKNSPVPTVGFIPAMPRLRVPPITMSDGSAGIRNGQAATALPAPIALASSWDTALAKRYGSVIGAEARDRAQQQVFAPAMNIDRDPLDGRNFEYFSEDPLLSGLIAGAEVKGIQSHGVVATLKHYVANNSEDSRGFVSADVSQRALHEIYEKNFGIAVAFGHPGSVMCSYNRINSIYACGNPYTLGDLRHVFGFTGYVVSDYPATHKTTDLAMGLNVELPVAKHFTLSAIRDALAAKTITRGQLNRRVYHTLKVLFQAGIFDRALKTSRIARLKDARAARRVDEQGAVLLKNVHSILPLTSADRRIAVIGYTAKHTAKGGGSSWVKPLSKDTAYGAISAAAGPGVTVTYDDGTHRRTVTKDAAAADVAVVFVRDYSAEGVDRSTLALPTYENNMVRAAVSANPNTVVVLETGAPILMPWLHRVPGALEAWYPGERGGQAIADLLFGDSDPSGKLAQTWPISNSQMPANKPSEFPGTNDEEHYSEGVEVGYRWYVDHNKVPRFPFGYGLSYTSYRYANLRLSRKSGPSPQRVKLSFSVTNTGTMAGSEIAQAYVNKPNHAVHTPGRELAGFAKVTLNPGQTKQVSMQIGPRQLSYWKTSAAGFEVQRGKYRLMAGSSSASLPLAATYTVTRNTGTLAVAAG